MSTLLFSKFSLPLEPYTYLETIRKRSPSRPQPLERSLIFYTYFVLTKLNDDGLFGSHISLQYDNLLWYRF